MIVLTVNAGSSSIRLDGFVAEGEVLRACAHVRHEAGTVEPDAALARFVNEQLPGPPGRVAHRVVHGGVHLTSARWLNADIEAEIERLAPLAPLHNPVALRWIGASKAALGEAVPQLAVFDTAFYARLPSLAASYALPWQVAEDQGIRRYGFHGLAHQAMWSRWCALRPDLPQGGRVISFQLGAGCSVTAINQGLPRDTSMGFSPLEGLVMASRAGDVDASVVTFLQRTQGLSGDEVDQMLNEHSGLLGVSGASGDMRRLLEGADNDPRQRFALDLYAYRARKYLGAYLAVLGGVDGILFGGGVGEHAPAIRLAILEGLAWAGVHLDEKVNATTVGREGRISANGPGAAVWVVPVDEARVLAAAVVSQHPAASPWP